MEVDFPLMTSFLVLSLDYAFELAMSRLMPERVDHVVEVSESVIDGDSIHFGRVKGSPGDQAPKTAKLVHSDLHHLSQGLNCFYLAVQEDAAICRMGGAERFG